MCGSATILVAAVLVLQPLTSPPGDATPATSAGKRADFVRHEPELTLDTGGLLSEVCDLAFSPDGRSLAVAGDKLVRIYDVDSGALITTLRGDRSRSSYGSVNSVAYSPDGKHLLVGIFDYHPRGSIRVYRTDQYDRIERLLPGHTSPCTFLRFNRDGKYLASSDSDGEICIWDWPAQKIIRRIAPRNPDKPIIDTLEFADRGPSLISIEYDLPHVYRVPDGAEIAPGPEMNPLVLGWMFDVISNRAKWPVALTNNNSPRVYDFQLENRVWAAAGVGTSGGANKYWIGLWKARPMAQDAPPNPAAAVYDKHNWRVRKIAISPRRDLVASGDVFGEVHLWEAATGRQQRVIKSLGRSIYNAAIDPQMTRIAFGTKPDHANWGFNRYGRPTQIIDLRQRTIRGIDDTVDLIDETQRIGDLEVSVQPPHGSNQSYHLLKNRGGRPAGRYRLPSGRHPAVFTLLSQPSLGVAEPVLFGDDQGLLAMWDTAGDEMRRYYHGHNGMITSLSPAPNGKLFVTGSTDRTIRIWSLVNYQPTGIFDFKYENSAVIQVPPGSSSARAGVRIGDRIKSFDGHSLQDVYEMMMTNHFDYRPGQVAKTVMQRGDKTYSYQMELKEGFQYVEPLLNIFVSDDGSWIIWTPQGYYDCSPGADRLIGWHVNQGPDKPAQYFRAEQFKRQLYRPDIINALLESGDFDEAVTAADQKYPQRGTAVDLTKPEALEKIAPPVVTMGAHEQEGDDLRVTLNVEVRSTNSQGISKVTLLHNGVPARTFVPGSDEQQLYKLAHRCRLLPGRNEFTFIAANSHATSKAEDAQLVLTAPASDQQGRVYLLAIGVSNYQNNGQGIDNLQFAATDAQAFISTVEKHRAGKLYADIQIKALINEDATRENVLGGLQWLTENVAAGDSVIIFAACHGLVERDSFYLATHDVDPARLRSTGVSWRELTGVLHEELPACRRIVFLDACHSAGVVGTDTRSPLHDLAAPELGTVFFASCTLQQKSFESNEWGHGAFTKAILDTASDPAADFAPRTGDGLLSTLELESGVSESVRVLTRDQQHPVVFVPANVGRFNVLELIR